MVEESDALERILARAIALEEIWVALREADGMFLAREIRAESCHPRFDHSSVDGFAVRVEDGLHPRRSIGEQPAGLDRTLQLGKNDASRIFTGAPIPNGATAVVMQEDTSINDGMLILRTPVVHGENIRFSGADLAAGQRIADAGMRVTPQLIALLASQAMATIPVHRRPRVAVLSTGDELRVPGVELNSGEIFDANGPMLAALVRTLGCNASLSHSTDNPLEVRSKIAAALEQNDVLIVSGGVSVGDHDHVRPALEELGVTLDFWRIRMKPGKPLVFGYAGKKLVFGLPGNPVSAFVTFLLLVRPALLQLAGAGGGDRFIPKRPVQLGSNFTNPGDRPHYIRGRVENGRFISVGRQESHALFGLSQCDALLRLDAKEMVAAGSLRSVLMV